MPKYAAWVMLAVCCSLGTSSRAEDTNVFLIGNSLTQDTLPRLLGEGVQWHIDCGKNLKYIYEHPQNPCVKSSMIWPRALAEFQYEILCVQPHFGTHLAEEVEIISKWLELQPSATLVLHTGWNRRESFEDVYHQQGDSPKQMAHQPAYFKALAAELKKRFPSREIRSTHAIELLDRVYHDIQQSKAPYESFSDLYRDDIHLKNQSGRYLAHNAMRIALGLPLSRRGFQVDPDELEYLDRVLQEHLKRYGPSK